MLKAILADYGYNIVVGFRIVGYSIWIKENISHCVVVYQQLVWSKWNLCGLSQWDKY